MNNQPGQIPSPDVQADRATVSRLVLSSFRNYDSLTVEFDHRPVVLSGANGVGKTNLLEALSFLSPGRGLRRAQLDDVARRPGNGTWAVAATIARSQGPLDIGTGLAMTPEGPEKRRSTRIEHTPARSASVLLDYLGVIWLTPAMDGLFNGPAGDRRRFVDRAVLAIDGRHASRVSAFERAIRGRNRLLSERGFDRAWADALEIEIAELGVAIGAARREWADLIVALVAESETDGPFPAAEITLEGIVEQRLQAGQSAGEVEEAYRAALAAERPRDAAAGRTLTGPHRSDLRIRHAPKQMAAQSCSTGEQKALLIGLVLAQAALISRLSGQTPLILLDEIAAHLDPARRVALFEILVGLGCQAFMTGTDGVVFEAFGEAAQCYSVADHALTPV
jgi:DNA replication and repair protein RecF